MSMHRNPCLPLIVSIIAEEYALPGKLLDGCPGITGAARFHCAASHVHVASACIASS